MKNLTVAKNISHILSRACAFVYFIYILSIAFMRAANLAPLTSDDIALISMFGAIVGILFIADYSIRMIRSAFKKQYRRTI